MARHRTCRRTRIPVLSLYPIFLVNSPPPFPGGRYIVSSDHQVSNTGGCHPGLPTQYYFTEPCPWPLVVLSVSTSASSNSADPNNGTEKREGGDRMVRGPTSGKEENATRSEKRWHIVHFQIGLRGQSWPGPPWCSLGQHASRRHSAHHHHTACRPYPLSSNFAKIYR